MKLQYMKESALYSLKENVSVNLSNYTNPTNDWLKEKFPESPFAEFKNEVSDFKMNMDADRPSSTDALNAKILYTALKSITPTQAVDERLWAGLTHGQFWDYMQYRCHDANEKINPNSILNNFFYRQNPRRAMQFNFLSRLWWIGKVTFDPNKAENHFETLRFFEKDFPTKTVTIFSSNLTNNLHVARAFLKSILDIEDEGGKVSRQDYQAMLRYLNVLGGAYILDYFEQHELVGKLKEYYKSSIAEKNKILVKQ